MRWSTIIPSYLGWMVRGFRRCLYCNEQPALAGFLCTRCEAEVIALQDRRQREMQGIA